MSKKKKQQPPRDIFALNAKLSELNAHLRAAAILSGPQALWLTVEGDLHGHNAAIDRLLPLEGFEALLSHARYAGHEQHLRFVRSSVAKAREKGDQFGAAKAYARAAEHLQRMRKIVRPTTNDSPYKVNDPVWVNRYEHGWDIGAGIVKAVRGVPPEIVSYTVELREPYGDYCIHVDHTRDLSRG